MASTEMKKEKPYKGRNRKIKKSIYRQQIPQQFAEDLYQKIYDIVITQKKFLDKDYSAANLAKELNTTPRYLSGVINSRFKMNYPCLRNGFRIKEAARMMKDKQHVALTLDDVWQRVGFANRQSFYSAFIDCMGETPARYRRRYITLGQTRKARSSE